MVGSTAGATATPGVNAAEIQELQKRLQELQAGAEQPPAVPTETVEVQGKTGFWRGLDSLIARNPKKAVAAAAAGGVIAGKMLSKNDNPTSLPQHVMAKIVGAAGGGAVSLLGVHAALAHLTQVVPTVSDILAQSPGNVATGLTIAAGALGVAAGHKVAKTLAERDTPSTEPKAPRTSLADAARKLAVAYSGPILGALAGAAVHLAGFSPVGEVATAAIGTFAGTLLGPIVNKDGIAKPWAWAMVPVPLAAGIYGALHLSDGGAEFFSVVGGLIGTAITGIAAAAHQNDEI